MRMSRSPERAARAASSARRLYGHERVPVVGAPLGVRVVEDAPDDPVHDQGAGLHHRPVVRDRELVHPEASVLVGFEEPLRGQVEQRLADGRRGDPVLLGDLLDGELPPRQQTPGEHLVTQRVRDLLPQGAAGDGSARAHGAPPRFGSGSP